MARRELDCQRCGNDPSRMDPPLVITITVGAHPEADPGSDVQPEDVEGRVPDIVHAIFADRYPPARQRMTVCVHCFEEVVQVARSEVTRHRANRQVHDERSKAKNTLPKRRFAGGSR